MKPQEFFYGSAAAAAGLAGAELGKSLGNEVGALAFSVMFGGSGKPLQCKIGKVHPEDLALWVQFNDPGERPAPGLIQ
ncbi:MAG: hypothetical protein ACYCZ6_07560 [Polaromonas sp.]